MSWNCRICKELGLSDNITHIPMDCESNYTENITYWRSRQGIVMGVLK